MTLKRATLNVDTGEVLREENEPVITVKAPDEKEPATLTERLKDFAPKPTRKPRAKRAPKGKQIDANLISKLAPTLVATFVATYSRQLTKEPYKMCAPSQQEVMTIVSPLFNILSRQVEITGQASETVIDLITCAIASIIFGTRAYVTYAQIKEMETNGKPSRNASGNIQPRNGSVATRSNSNEDNSDIGASEPVGTNGSNGATNGDSSDQEHARRDAALFNELFNKDVEGRIRLGYLPPRDVPRTDE